MLGGAGAAITGYLLMFPFYATDIAGMQTTQSLHGIFALVFIAIMLAHIYIGSIGMEGAFESMGTGTVDENWAKQHHQLWLEEERRRTSGQPSAQPAE
jgi:formate dehydrogenase subunit gamma